MKLHIGQRVRINDTDHPEGSEYSCHGVTGVVTLVDNDPEAPGFEMAHDDYPHMDLNWYRADMAEVLP